MKENETKTTLRQEGEPKRERTEEQRQKRKKLLVYPLLFTLFGVVLWLIFAPSKKEQALHTQGFNTNVPAPNNEKMADDKKSAYERERMKEKATERQKQMHDLASMFRPEEEKEVSQSVEPQPRETIHASANAYHDINRTLGNFYEEPAQDLEKEEMRREIEELREMVHGRQSAQEVATDQLALLEKSYELAAKYMPSGQGATSATAAPPPTAEPTATTTPVRNGKAMINSVRQVAPLVVTTLSQPISDSAFMADYAKERNLAFHTAVGGTDMPERNTIAACVHGNHTILDGQSVRLRLLEPMRVGTTLLPKNCLVTGMGKIAGDRLNIDITSLEYNGLILPVELTVMDADGQSGIFMPGSMELNAAKEVAANMGSSLGTSISITNQGAGDQLLTELGKGAIQGASQYISKKVKVVKVHLKAGYRVMLYQGGQ